MMDKAVSAQRARQFYDWIGARYDWFEFYEGRAKQLARKLLALRPGERFLNLGVGTGKSHVNFLQDLSPGGISAGLDLSPVMARLAYLRTGAPMVQADARLIPFAPGSFDALYAAYVLDLIPAVEIPIILTACMRVVAPGGRLVLLSLTEGVSFGSRGLVAAWKLLYSLAPMVCGGCRPLILADWVKSAGFRIKERETLVQWGVPSEIVVAIRPRGE